MEVRLLQWDSQFFGLRIGRVDLCSHADSAELQRQDKALRKKYDLLYVFDMNKSGFTARGAQPVDEKIVYKKTCEARRQYDEVSFYEAEAPTADLYNLALLSGTYSRFRLDPQLPSGSYERLYRRWIEKACPSMGTNKHILVYPGSERRIKGMITFDSEGKQGHIGLVAVDRYSQRQGIGGMIMSTLEGYLFKKGVETLSVPTQKKNTDACRWYERQGFTIESVTPVYHWWL